MAKKENKAGILTNEQVEKDNEVKGKSDQQGQNIGTQDTGDATVRHLGNEVQRNDGIIEDKEPGT